jgi:hypothetical protein
MNFEEIRGRDKLDLGGDEWATGRWRSSGAHRRVMGI